MPNYLLGIAVGGTNGSFVSGGGLTTGSTTGGHVAFFDIATFGSFYAASSSSFSYFSNRTTRTFGAAGVIGETDTGNFNSYELRSRLEFGRHFAAYGGTITPFVALEIADLRSNGFVEASQSGAGNYLLNVSGQSSASVPSFVGARFQQDMTLGGGTIFSPSLQAAFVHDFAPVRTLSASFATLPGSVFIVNGASPAYNSAQVKVGFELLLTPRSAIFASFDGDFSGQSQFYGGKGGLRYTW